MPRREPGTRATPSAHAPPSVRIASVAGASSPRGSPTSRGSSCVRAAVRTIPRASCFTTAIRARRRSRSLRRCAGATDARGSLPSSRSARCCAPTAIRSIMRRSDGEHVGAARSRGNNAGARRSAHGGALSRQRSDASAAAKPIPTACNFIIAILRRRSSRWPRWRPRVGGHANASSPRSRSARCSARTATSSITGMRSGENSRGDWTRTSGLNVPNVPRYQLRYAPGLQRNTRERGAPQSTSSCRRRRGPREPEHPGHPSSRTASCRRPTRSSYAASSSRG